MIIKEPQKNIETKAREFGFLTPNPEIACLIIDKFSGKELLDMGFIWVVTMHNPIETPNDILLFSVFRFENNTYLSTYTYDLNANWWVSDIGFAYIAPIAPKLE